MIIYLEETPLLKTILSPILVLRSAHHLPQLKLLGEFSRYRTKISDGIMASRDEGILGRYFAVRLYTKFEFVYERMWDLCLVSLSTPHQKG